VSAKLIIK